MSKNIFLTTTLPYANGNPHAGHMFEFIFGDVLARYLRKNNEVVFNLGLDEHGSKVAMNAEQLGITPQEYVDTLLEVWLNFCDKFNISYDIFYRTSDESHANKVKTIWNLLVYSGDIYKKHYKGQYCKGCESYKTSKDLINNRCPDHDIDGMLVTIEEENYFFKLTNYKQAIRNYIKETEDFLLPIEKRQELLNLALESEDISISRSKIGNEWNVDVPGDDTQIIYIWFSALLNYIFAAGYLTPLFKWQNVIQICGPDNLRFQGVIFQAFLKALKIPFTNTLLVHGTILDGEGKKMSKSVGNTVDPMEQLEKYGIDAVRFYAVAGIQNYTNSAWSEKDLVNKFNSEICDDFGNLVARVTHLCETKQPERWIGSYLIDDNPKFKDDVNAYFKRVEEAWRKFDVNGAFSIVNEVVKYGNAYVNDTKPWTLKTEQEIWPVLTCLKHLLHWVNESYSVLFPDKCDLIRNAISNNKKIIAFTKLK